MKRGSEAMGGALAVLAALLVVGCGDAASTTLGPLAAPNVKLAVNTSVTTTWLLVGETMQLNANVLNPAGKSLPTKKHLTWRSTKPLVASVDDQGLLAAAGAGDALIIAALGRSADTLEVTVIPSDAIYSVTITPAVATSEIGSQVSLTVTLRNARDAIVAGATPAWTTLDPSIAAVFGGVVTGYAAGTARIVAEANGRADTAMVTVVPPLVSLVVVSGGLPELPAYNTGCPIELSDDVKYAYAYDARGDLISGRPITWRVGPRDVLTRTSRSGLPANAIQITGVTAGTGSVEATIDGVTGSATVTVYNCGTLTITPNPARVAEFGVVQLTASFSSPSGTLVNPSTNWTTSDPAIARVNEQGLVFGFSPGTVTITNSYLSLRATTSVTVEAATAGGAP